MEAKRLQTRLEQMNGDFDGEFQVLQKVSPYGYSSSVMILTIAATGCCSTRKRHYQQV